MAAALQDQQEETRAEVLEAEAACKRAQRGYEEKESRLLQSRSDAQLRSANTMAQLLSQREEVRLKRQELQQATSDLFGSKKQCASTLMQHEERVGNLRQLRAEVALQVSSVSTEIHDCEVSPWIPGPCSKTCGGGEQMLSRHITTAASSLGAPCPELTVRRACATRPCPTDCQVSDWNEWSACSAACGEGTRSRTRRVELQPQNGGEPCPEETIVSTTCSERPCDATECVLSPWSAWTSCSRACGGGLRQRSRSLRNIQGDPEACPKLEDEQRIQYLRCNNATCPEVTTEPVKCAAQLDIAVVIDGSGGCGPTGFAETKAFITALSMALDLGPNKTQVALTVAGGMSSFAQYESCLGLNGGSIEDCNVKMTMPLSSDIGAVSLIINQLAWPGGPGHLGSALAHAGAMLKQMGRPGVPPVVLVVTRGHPLSISRTSAAAEALRPSIRVAWVLLGEDTPKEEAARWASQPTRDNVLELQSPPGLAPGSGSGGALAAPDRISQVITAVCPKVAAPAGAAR